MQNPRISLHSLVREPHRKRTEWAHNRSRLRGHKSGAVSREGTWTEGEAAQLSPSPVQFGSATQLQLTLFPDDPGIMTVTVITPKGFSVTAMVTVK